MTIILRGHEIQENTVELQDEDCNISDCEEYLSQEKCLNEILVPEFMCTRLNQMKMHNTYSEFEEQKNSRHSSLESIQSNKYAFFKNSFFLTSPNLGLQVSGVTENALKRTNSVMLVELSRRRTTSLPRIPAKELRMLAIVSVLALTRV